ncbi:TlpA disulfide reductase family protein [Tenacibaculum sp. SG-28]|uniref:TlpA family protein disulfide reductase n=1 Tax=Tenacibaculum sp. SG-28 TaxID=754426 RepID=UPI000CF4D0E3|nr:TlpA disulfide reductase family protein [Tenacibaculum sp. SG-28]PQJ20623.1 redoxin family protein [Tenacibaculum sp. SG-28]
MNKLVTLLLLLITITSFSQTHYYSTNGKNRMTETEIKEQLSEMESKMNKALGKKVYASLVVQGTVSKKDSIISNVTFKISDKKQDELFSTGPFARYKDKQFPNFNLKTLAGEKFDTQQLKDKPTVINFWFTKCKPCIDEMPILNKIKEKYKEDINFISITYEKKDAVLKFLEKHPFEFQHLVDAKDFTDDLGITAYPLNLFLDRNGILKYVNNGIPYESKEGGALKIGDGTEIVAIIEKLI